MVNGRTEADDMEREYQRQSLRDTFAAAALTGMMSRVAGKAEALAEAAYRLADAMLRERDKTSAEKPIGSGSVTLTDAERTAIGLAIESESTPDVHYLTPAAPSVRDTLRGLLERLGGLE